MKTKQCNIYDDRKEEMLSQLVSFLFEDEEDRKGRDT